MLRAAAAFCGRRYDDSRGLGGDGVGGAGAFSASSLRVRFRGNEKPRSCEACIDVRDASAASSSLLWDCLSGEASSGVSYLLLE